LPFCHVHLRGQRPPDPRYPSELRTLGDELRKHRLDLGLTQQEVAGWLRVTAFTVRNWELGLRTPLGRFRVAIQAFLGHGESQGGDQFPADCRRLRWLMGASQKGLAARLSVDRSTVVGWETGRHRPRRAHRDVIASLLGQVIRDPTPTGPKASPR